MVRLVPSMCLLVLLVCSAAIAGDPPDSTLALSCPVCHGERATASAVPGLYGRTQADLSTVLREYRDSMREGTAMPRLMLPASDADIDALVRTYGESTP